VSPLYGPHWPLVAITIWLSLIGVVLWGTLSGSLLPIVLKRAGLDPAVSSAPFVATLVDVTGIIIYFSVAAVIMRGTLLYDDHGRLRSRGGPDPRAPGRVRGGGAHRVRSGGDLPRPHRGLRPAGAGAQCALGDRPRRPRRGRRARRRAEGGDAARSPPRDP